MDQRDFYRGWKVMEERDQEEALEAPLEDRLVRGILEKRRKPWRRWPVAVGAMALAMAACLLLFLQPREPRWDLTIEPNETHLGSTGTEPPASASAPATLTADSVLRLALRPHHATTAKVSVRAWLRREGAALSPWEVQLVPSPKGTYRLRVPLSDLGLSPGRYQLVFAAGERGPGPDTAQVEEALRRVPPASAAGWQVLHHDLVVTR